MLKSRHLYHLLEHSAAAFPENTAVVFAEREVSYQQLNAAADTISILLQSIHVGEGDRVAVCCPKSIAAVAALFGILKSGAAYLPVDAASPAERNRFIVENSEAAAIILSKEGAAVFEAEFTLVGEISEDLLLLKNNKTTLRKSPDDLAYILYTSGSTGVPKGVMHSHSAALEFIDWCSAVFSPKAKDRFSSHAPFHFDLSVFDLYVAVKHAAAMVLIREETAKQPLLLAQLLAEQHISILYATPSVLMLLSEYGKIHKYDYRNLRLILFAGEVFPLNKFLELKEQLPAADYYNLYGPTETNVCTYYHVPETQSTAIPIGKVCEHYQSMILEGELLIAGNGLMLGYWDKAKEETFWEDEQGTDWYKTGDLVTTNENSELIFKGRRDRMVKRNGYRIELDEIETALNKHPEITECAVISFNNNEGLLNIAAFVVLKEEAEKSLLKMKEYCMNCLPSYMIPNDFIFVAQLPYTSSHKVDYQKLKQFI